MKKREKKTKEWKATMYARFGSKEQLNDYETNKIRNKNATGIYIRSRCENEEGLNYSIDSQISRLKKYCEENNIDNVVEYVDIGVGANSDNRPALRKMVADIDKGIINKIIVTSPDRLFRDAKKMYDFGDKCILNEIELIALDIGNITDTLYISEIIENDIRKEIKNMENDMEY